jgi:hypothetical protein
MKLERDYSRFSPQVCSGCLELDAISSMKDSILEVIVHPNFISHGVLVDALSGEKLAHQLKKLKELEEKA